MKMQIKIRHKLLFTSIASLIALGLITVTLLLSLRNSMLEDKRQLVKNVVETAYGTLQHYHELVSEGKLTQEEAQKRAIDAIKSLIYNGNEYFWLNDMRPVMIMHPVKYELDGKDLSEIKDPNGKKLFIEFVQMVKDHQEGYVEYLWPKPNFDKPVPKISYVKGFEPWGWIIGSGLYIDDVNAAFWSKSKWFTIIFIVFTIVVGGLNRYVRHDLTNMVHQKVKLIDRIAKGDISMTFSIDRNDEFGDIDKSLQIMIDNLRQTVSKISTATSSLASSSEVLSATSDDFNKGAQELSSQTEQVVTALTEVSQTVIDMAKNASRAADASKTASETASKGKAVIETTTHGMTSIATTVQGAATTIEGLGGARPRSARSWRSSTASRTRPIFSH